MASYNITSPDGQTYKINAPDDATQEQVLAYAQKNFSMAKVSPAEEKSLMARMGQHGGNLLAGAVRGAGSIGATLIQPFETSTANKERRQSMDDALQSFGAEPDSNVYGLGKIGAEIAGTAGAGGVIDNAGRLLPGAARMAARNAISPPAENPRMPTLAGSMAHSSARCRTRRSARWPSARPWTSH